MRVSKILDGNSYQDLVDIQGEPGRYWKKPEWVVYGDEFIRGGWDFDLADNEFGKNYSLTEGEYVISVGFYALPNEMWFCAPLEVTRLQSE